MAEAVSKAKSKKERGQNKVVLDVADLFAGNAIPCVNSDMISSVPVPFHAAFQLYDCYHNPHFIQSSKSFILPHFFLQLDTLMLPAPLVHPTLPSSLPQGHSHCSVP